MKYLLSFFAVLVFSFPVFAQFVKDDRLLAPTFKVELLDGKIFSSPDLKGKIVVLNLWFVNCPRCVEEIKLLNKIVDDYGNNRDVVFIGLAINTRAELENFLEKNPFKYSIVPNAGDFMLFAFGERQKDGSYFLPFPTHVVIDRDGRIISKTSGVKGVEVVKSELARQFNK
ncbi:MAG: TlpA family protein disulfide reductase [Pyrinomonadaceae bacterium]